MPEVGPRDELEGPGSESRMEFPAAVVGLRGHFHRGASDAQAAAGRQVLDGEVEKEEQVVPEQGRRLAVGDQFGERERNVRRVSGCLRYGRESHCSTDASGVLTTLVSFGVRGCGYGRTCAADRIRIGRAGA